jgi:RNA polymerase sigma-70 factor (ECF subfamily)
MANWVSAEWLAGVLDEHSAALELFAAQWSEVPEDCVQEAIIELVRQPECPINVAAWLFHVVRCRAISSNRSISRRRRHEAMAARLVRMESSPGNDSGFDVQELSAGLAQLDDELREVLVARIWGGLGFAEIGGMLNLSTSTAFRRFEAGLSALRGILEGPCVMTTSGPKTGPTKKSK